MRHPSLSFFCLWHLGNNHHHGKQHHFVNKRYRFFCLLKFPIALPMMEQYSIDCPLQLMYCIVDGQPTLWIGSWQRRGPPKQYLFVHYSEIYFRFSFRHCSKRSTQMKELLLKICTGGTCFNQKQSKLDKYLFE